MEKKHLMAELYLQKHFSHSTVMFVCFKTIPTASAGHVYYRCYVDTTLEKITMVWQPEKSFKNRL